MLAQGEFWRKGEGEKEGEQSGGVDPWGWVFTWMPEDNPPH